jgi:arginine exporter protein ArgO
LFRLISRSEMDSCTTMVHRGLNWFDYGYHKVWFITNCTIANSVWYMNLGTKNAIFSCFTHSKSKRAILSP